MSFPGPVGEYRMPFEMEVGSHPSLESMQDLVVNKKSRPHISEQWLESKVTTCERERDSDSKNGLCIKWVYVFLN